VTRQRRQPIGADLDSEGRKKAEKGGKGQSARKIMEEKLIIAVYGFPELYDSTLFVYRDIKKKYDSWRKVAVGVSGEL